MTTIFNPISSATPNWLANAWADAEASQSNASGLLGALQSASSKVKPGSIAEFLNGTAGTDLSTITLNSTVNATALALAQGDAVKKQASDAAMQKVLKGLSDLHNNVKPNNVLDPVIYLGDGSTIDTVANILTRADGKQFNSVTGSPYVDSTFIVQMANGAYLDTKNNVMTLGNGTRIDTTTGLTISVTA